MSSRPIEPMPTSNFAHADENSPVVSANNGETRTRLRPLDSSFVRLTLVGSVVLGAIALLPYAIMRRRFLALEQRLERTTTANAALQHDVQKLLEQDAVRRSERKQLGGLIAETKNIMEEVRRAGDRRESEQRMLNDKLVRGVQELKSLVESTEAAAEERHLVGTNLKFRWPGLKKP